MGGFAEVFLAEDPNLDSQVAIKILSEAFSAEPEIVSRFIAEARVMRSLAAPRLVSVYDSGEHEGRPYFVMEYCERGTLEDRIIQLQRPLTVTEANGLAHALSAAVRELHRASPPVVHRDIKPGNLLIRHTPRTSGQAVGQLLAADEQLILGDFGLAKIVDPAATKLSLIAYTRGYAAPEQTRGDPTIGPTADVYSASAVIAVAVSGIEPRPIANESDQAFDDNALAATGPLRRGIEQGLAFDPKKRPADIEQWLSGLGQKTETAAETESRESSVQPQSTPKRWLASLAVLLAVISAAAFGLGVGGLAWLRANSGSDTILGPTQGLVGDEVAFLAVDGEELEWTVSNQPPEAGRVFAFEPQTTGRVRMVVATTEGDVEFDYDVEERTSELRIGGPGHLSIGEVVTLRLLDAEGNPVADEVTWQVAGNEHQVAALSLNPTEFGLLTVQASVPDRDTIERVFTVG